MFIAGCQGLELGGQEAEERRELLIRQEVRQMKTGEDAVAYFTRHGANTKLKLIHCVSAHLFVIRKLKNSLI